MITKWIDGSRLMERWGENAFEISQLIYHEGLKAYDTSTGRLFDPNPGPNAWMGVPGLTRSELGFISSLTPYMQKSSMSVLRFKLTDVEEFEKKYPELTLKAGNYAQAQNFEEEKKAKKTTGRPLKITLEILIDLPKRFQKRKKQSDNQIINEHADDWKISESTVRKFVGCFRKFFPEGSRNKKLSELTEEDMKSLYKGYEKSKES